MFNLSGKVALVTGASRGIGRATAIALARAGAEVAINYQNNESRAAETLDAIRQAGGKGELSRFDVANAEAVDAAITKLHQDRGRLDILVNNAGIAVDQLLLRVRGEDLERTWATNVNGAIYCAKSAVRLMMRAKTGRIINLSSVVAESGNPGQSVYSASKAALIGLTKTLAQEYASRGITVNAVAPGYIETDMTNGLPEKARTEIAERIPMGRVGSPEEVAAAIVYLSSDEAGYVTGQVIRINGGLYV